MKFIFLSVLISITVTGLGNRVYTLSKDDFIDQFNDSSAVRRIYCFNKKGNKVWLVCQDNALVILNMKTGKPKLLPIQSVRVKDSTIEEFGSIMFRPGRSRNKFSIADVQSISIEANYYDREFPYFNLDSTIQSAKFKNDSLEKAYSSVNRFVIYLTEKNVSSADTLLIQEGAAYHLSFKDNRDILFGVVKKITGDSLSISNALNENMARHYKLKYSVYTFAINEITQLQLLASNGFKFRKLKLADYNIHANNVSKNSLRCPNWFKVNPNDGTIDLYYSWLTTSGFLGVTEQDGRAVWYEGVQKF